MASKAHWPSTRAQLAAWQESLRISPEMIRSLPAYVAEVSGNVAGFFLLVPQTTQWKLEHFWVHPSSMGHGLGRSMLSAATGIAAAGGAASILIESDPNAEPFYVACGARRIGERPAPIEGAEKRVLPLLVLSTG